MRRSLWIAGALAGAMFSVGGCGHAEVASDEGALGHIAMNEKEEIFTAQHNVEVAEANLDSAKRAYDDAKAFDGIAASELDASKSRLNASRHAIELGEKSGDSSQLRSGRVNADLAEKQLVAFRAKKDYASRLVDLRAKEVDLASRQLDQAQTEHALARVNVLRRNGIAPREDVASIMNDRVREVGDVASLQQQVSTLRGDVDHLRIAWQEKRHSYDVASRETTPPPLAPPSEPENIKPAPMPRTPGSDQLMQPRNL